MQAGRSLSRPLEPGQLHIRYQHSATYKSHRVSYLKPVSIDARKPKSVISASVASGPPKHQNGSVVSDFDGIEASRSLTEPHISFLNMSTSSEEYLAMP